MTTGDGFAVFDFDEAVSRWVDAAHAVACQIAADPVVQSKNLRHGGTWFVGVDVLPNAPDGSMSGAPLAGGWRSHIPQIDHWHPAQLSIVYPGYPKQDADESDANHRYRINRFAAHVDGLLPMGPDRRRYLKEPHAFILGLPLNRSNAAPLMVWPGSHQLMGDALRAASQGKDPTEVDITDVYQSARRDVFDQIEPVPLLAEPGQAILLHRHLLHGVGVWNATAHAPPEGRMIAYFRPQFSPQDWMRAD